MDLAAEKVRAALAFGLGTALYHYALGPLMRAALVLAMGAAGAELERRRE